MAIDPLLQRLNELSWPTVVLDQPEPVSGQLWRAEWDGTACLVVVSGKRVGRILPVMAATSDHVGDEKTIVVETRNGMTLSVWTGVARTIKTFTLDHRIADLTSSSFDLITRVAEGARSTVVGLRSPTTSTTASLSALTLLTSLGSSPRSNGSRHPAGRHRRLPA